MRDNLKPIMSNPKIKPLSKAKSGNSQLSDPGITFNESGISFNESGITFGGVYGFTSSVKPSIILIQNIPSSIQSSGISGQSIGLLLAITRAS